MSIKIQGVDEFARDLTAFAKIRLPKEVKLVQTKIAFDLLGKIVRRTPVGDPDLWSQPAPPGYVGGRARANWQVQVGGTPGNDVIEQEDAGGETTIADGESEVLAADPFSIIWIFNNVPYIVRLEEGWSSQAAPGVMIALSVEEVDASFGG